MKDTAITKLLFAALLWTGLSLNLFAESFRYAVIPDNPCPGEPVTIAIRVGDTRTVGASITNASAILMRDGKRLAKAVFFSVPAEGGKQGFMAAVLAIPSTAQPGRAVIVLENAAGAIGEIPLDIAEREFISETIDLNASLTSLRTEPDPKKTAESNQLWAILNRTGSEVYHFGNFTPPVSSTRRTSFFGTRRVYRYSNGRTDVSIHAGIDYGVPTGTVVSTCAPGRVVLARDRIVTGKSVIIEHLPGIYSLYYHLDKIEVSEGVLIAAGTRLGLSGATGLATGPHLHWEIRVFGENTDPDAFIARPILDKDAILRRMNSREWYPFRFLFTGETSQSNPGERR